MLFTCPKCHTTYNVPDELMGDASRVRCASCGHEWDITEQRASSSAEAYNTPSAEDLLQTENLENQQEEVSSNNEQAISDADSFAILQQEMSDLDHDSQDNDLVDKLSPGHLEPAVEELINGDTLDINKHSISDYEPNQKNADNKEGNSENNPETPTIEGGDESLNIEEILARVDIEKEAAEEREKNLEYEERKKKFEASEKVRLLIENQKIKKKIRLFYLIFVSLASLGVYLYFFTPLAKFPVVIQSVSSKTIERDYEVTLEVAAQITNNASKDITIADLQITYFDASGKPLSKQVIKGSGRTFKAKENVTINYSLERPPSFAKRALLKMGKSSSVILLDISPKDP
ncbi:MAG: zinc-ribbon domain-containing protein [Alphaproteobacteria bacterium]|nr:zinc-ribbon domain-containing protein [Alphaproteobacteria bacterium]